MTCEIIKTLSHPLDLSQTNPKKDLLLLPLLLPPPTPTSIPSIITISLHITSLCRPNSTPGPSTPPPRINRGRRCAVFPPPNRSPTWWWWGFGWQRGEVLPWCGCDAQESGGGNRGTGRSNPWCWRMCARARAVHRKGWGTGSRLGL